jgi:hypothetical protein
MEHLSIPNTKVGPREIRFRQVSLYALYALTKAGPKKVSHNCRINFHNWNCNDKAKRNTK